VADRSNNTEKTTPRRLEKARKEGQVPVSREFVGAIQFVTFVALLGAWGAWLFHETRTILRVSIGYAFQTSFTPGSVFRLAEMIGQRIFLGLGVAGLALLIVTLASHFALTRLNFSLKKLQPDLSRLSSLKKLREMPRQNAWAVIQSSFVLVLFGCVVYFVGREHLRGFFLLPMTSLPSGIQKVGASLLQMLWEMSGVFVIFGIVDLVRQRRRYTKDLRMSKHEIQDETKESEGHPQVKMRIRRIQRDMRRRRMMSEIPTASAVIVNPTHYAVAIRYRHESMSAPVVVAKGKNYLALRIRQRALEHQVPLVENAPLAQALYKSVDVGQEIPPQLYRAIAEILAYLHRLSGGRLTR